MNNPYHHNPISYTPEYYINSKLTLKGLLLFISYILVILLFFIILIYINNSKISDLEFELQGTKQTNRIYEEKLKFYAGVQGYEMWLKEEEYLEYTNYMLENYNLTKYEFKDQYKEIFMYPIKNPKQCYIASSFGEYGYRPMEDPALKWHHGFDIIMVFDSEVISPMDGIVYAEHDSVAIGSYVMITKTYGGIEYMVLCSHLSERKVLKGETVGQGDLIGIEGNTGKYARGFYHLHCAFYKKTKDYWVSFNPFKNSCHGKYDQKEFRIYDFLVE